VPSDDSDYDLVYAKVEAGKVYRISFTNLVWEEMPDERFPAAVDGF